MTIKDSTTCNGFSFKGVGGHSLSVWLLIPLLFPLLPRFSLWPEEVESVMARWNLFLLARCRACPFEGILCV